MPKMLWSRTSRYPLILITPLTRTPRDLSPAGTSASHLQTTLPGLVDLELGAALRSDPVLRSFDTAVDLVVAPLAAARRSGASDR